MMNLVFLVIVLGALAALVGPLVMGKRLRVGEMLSGTLLVTGVSDAHPGPDAVGEQYVTITGVINGPTVGEHVVYQRMRTSPDSWPVVGQLVPVQYSPKNPDNWRFAGL